MRSGWRPCGPVWRRSSLTLLLALTPLGAFECDPAASVRCRVTPLAETEGYWLATAADPDTARLLVVVQHRPLVTWVCQYEAMPDGSAAWLCE